jgi:hypothetical protein
MTGFSTLPLQLASLIGFSCVTALRFSFMSSSLLPGGKCARISVSLKSIPLPSFPVRSFRGRDREYLTRGIWTMNQPPYAVRDIAAAEVQRTLKPIMIATLDFTGDHGLREALRFHVPLIICII